MVQRKQKDFPKILEEVLSKIIGTGIDIDLDRDSIAIENLREYTEKQSSLLFSNPNLVKEWNYERNGNLKPEHFTKNSGKKVWWKCSKGHEWQERIIGRNRGSGCPFCSGRYSIVGENDLQTVNPLLADEWHYEKNDGLTPIEVLPNSNKKVWWKCSEGHEWQARIADRNKGRGCPKCHKEQESKG